VKSGDPLDLCTGVKNQSETTSRPLIWEDDAPAASRFRRMQQAVPGTGRPLPGMPLDMDDIDGDNPPRAKWNRKGEGSGRWWWPANTLGRVGVGVGLMIILAVLVTAGDLIKTYLQRDGRFRITGASHIQAVGLTEVTRAQLLPVFGEDIGRNVFFVPLNVRRKELESIPWIQQATVMRLLPDQIRVDIVERKPVAFTRHRQQIGLVDASGVLLEMAPSAMAAHHYSFPVLTGIDAGDKPVSRQARMALYQRLMSDLDGNGKRNSEQLSEIDLTDPEDARVLMPEQGTDILAHFGEDHFLERFQRYKDHITEWRQQYPNLAAVDLRYEHQVVLDMASGASRTQANSDGASAKALTEINATDAVISPAKPKPTAKGASDNNAAHEKSAHEKSKIRANEKTSSNGSTKAKSSASKSKGAVSKGAASKSAADKKHAASKTTTQHKVTTPGKSSASSKTAVQHTGRPTTSSAARQMAAEGQ
jgi:cell division protein FtsQ